MSLTAQTNWQVDQSHSSINFAVTHMLISETTGNFKSFNISANSDMQLSNPQVDVEIDAASINTNMEMRDKHLRAPDFFDVDKHPSIRFKSTRFEQKNDSNFAIHGNITIKGITKAIQFEGKLNGIVDNPHTKQKTAGLKLTSSVSRSDFGIGDPGGTIGDEVRISINLEMAPQN